ncbi:MAG: pyridoxal-phosphate dependent enzyme [Francisellaceae bacterium]|nr:pyridoxal-phosphate dependent enzyme [Francisellaceae bacterium]
MERLYVKTPLIYSDYYSDLLEVNVYLKLENLQPSGSFKSRGIGVLCQHYASLGKKVLIASSGGNAGLAVAYSAKKLKLQAKIFVPNSTPHSTIIKIENLGAKVTVIGDVWDETDTYARKDVDNDNAGYISPFDHPVIWQGHSTIVEEIADDLAEEPSAIACSVGGGGLLCGIIQGCDKLNWNNVTLITSETKGANSFYQCYQKKEVVKLDKVDTIAKTLGAKQVTKGILPYLDNHKIMPLLVSDAEALAGAVSLAHTHRMLVEPACGATLALCYSHKEKLKSFKNIVLIVCGGSGTSLITRSISTED